MAPIKAPWNPLQRPIENTPRALSIAKLSMATSPSSVRASLQYIKDLDIYKHEKPYMIADIEHIPKHQRSNIKLEKRQVSIEDIRGQEGKFTIERNSFEFVKHGHPVPYDDETSLESYVAATSALVQERFMADRVICYDSLVSSVLCIYDRPINQLSTGKMEEVLRKSGRMAIQVVLRKLGIVTQSQ